MKWMALFTASVIAALGAVRQDGLLRKLPLRFEPDSSGTHFTAHTAGYELRLSPDGSDLEWTRKGSGIRTRLLGANPRTRLEPEQTLDGETNYFVGDKRAWRTGVAGYGRVRYRNVYRGVDLVFHGDGGLLEYDFVVAPNADPSAIKLALSGQESAVIADSGDLILRARGAEIRWKKPVIYQEVNGARQPVGGRFRIEGQTVTFEIDPYNQARTLVIDPTLAYSTYLGGSGNDGGRGIGVDGAGNIYIAGNTASMNLPTVSAVQPLFGGQTANYMNGDGFIAKFSPAGALLYLTYLGGSGDDAASAIAVDSAGDAYVVGMTTSSDFPLMNPYQARFGGMGGSGFVRSGDAFAAKLNPSGNKLMYSTYLGGSQDDAALAVTIDSLGDAFIAGATSSTNFPVTTGVYQIQFRGGGGEPIRDNGYPGWDPGDAFVAKLDPTGSQLLFSTYVGGGADDVAFTIALDASSNVYIGGCTISTDFPTTSGALQRVFGGIEAQNEFMNFGDGFVTKLNPTATSLIYSTYFGGMGDDCVSSIAVDATGSVYMTGSTSTENLPTTPNAFQPLYGGYTLLPFLVEQLFGDAFVAKLNPAGSALTYLSYLGGDMNDAGMAIAVDTSGNAYVTGFADSPNFPIAGAPLQPKMAGDGGFDPYIQFGDAFLTVVNPTGTALLYSSYFGGNYDDEGGGLALDGAGKVYMTGTTISTTFPTTSAAVQPKYAGGGPGGSFVHGDAFFATFSGFSLNGPAISLVANAEGQGPTIAPNTWVEVKGSALSTTTRPWQGSDFVNNMMPTLLDGVSVTVNGEKAFVYYVSPAQVNILTPPDLVAGPAQIVVNNSSGNSAVYTVQAQALSPSFFIVGAGPYILATHLTNVGSCLSTAPYCLVGSASLYPGVSSPASPGETIVLYMNGFGPVAPPVTSGSATQSGILPAKPQVLIANQPGTVTFAGVVSPGLYQFNVTVPLGIPAGDDFVVVNYNSYSTAAGALITIQ